MRDDPAPALRGLGLSVSRRVSLSRDGEAPAYRLDLADGGRVKARLFPTAHAAARVERLLRRPEARDLPQPLARSGRVLVVEWVAGRSAAVVLAEAPERNARLVRAAGRLLARLHAGRPAPRAAPPPERFHARLAETVRGLGRAGLLDAAESDALERLQPPATARGGLTHGDVCPQNLVVSGGRLRAVDEERLAFRPLAFDLARTVCRWPLSAADEPELLAGYREGGGDPRTLGEHRPFWIAAALATSAAYRLRRPPHAPGPALGALRALAAELRRPTRSRDGGGDGMRVVSPSPRPAGVRRRSPAAGAPRPVSRPPRPAPTRARA